MREKRSETISIVTTKEVRKDLEKIAQASNWTLSSTCYFILRKYLAEQKHNEHLIL